MDNNSEYRPLRGASPPPLDTPFRPFPPQAAHHEALAPPTNEHNPYDNPYEQPHAKFDRPGSPTPSELEEMNEPLLPPGWYKQPKYILMIVVSIIIIGAIIAINVFHSQIQKALTPAGDWLKSKPYGWIIPIAILFVLSFPPLFGQEIVAVLCGDIYGLGIGFLIVCAGTLLGEIGNFYAFKYICKSRAAKFEEKSLTYACLAKATREGGFKLIVMARLSAYPPHFTTALFATIGTPFLSFLGACTIALVKQFSTVALGVLVNNSHSSISKILTAVVIVVTVAFTIYAQRYIRKKVSKQKLIVVRERRAKRNKALGAYEHEEYA